MDDIWELNGGLYLGFENGKPVQFVTPRHCLLYGPNSSGKSRRVIITNLATLTGWSVVAIDFKAELCRSTAIYRAGKGNNVITLNPFKAGGLNSSGFNPVAALKIDDDLPDNAMNLATAMITVDGLEPHWPESAQDLIAALIMYSRLTGENGGSLNEVRRRLAQSSLMFKKDIGLMMKYGAANDWPELYAKAARFHDISPEHEELNSIISHASTKTRWLDSRPIKEDLKGGDHDWAKLKETPTTVYLILPGNRTGTHMAWIKVVLTSIIQSLMASAENSKVPVLFMLDEAAKLGGLPIIEENMAMMRGYGIKLMSVYQDVPQARLALKERFYSYQANSGVFIAFGAQDMDTARLISERAGYFTGHLTSTTIQPDDWFGKKPSSPTNISQTKLPILAPQDVIGMSDGDAVLFTHKDKHVRKVHFPDPSTLPQMKDIV